MAYQFKTTKKRSEIMRAIKSENTSPEEKLRKSLWGQGYRYRKNYKRLPGNPDIIFASSKVAVFVDGEFWHGYKWESKKKKISSNRGYWIDKIERNINRDKKVNSALVRMGWTVLRFWQHEVEQGTHFCIKKIESHLGV